MKQKKAVLNSILSQGMLPLFFYEDAEVSGDDQEGYYCGGKLVYVSEV